MSFKDITKEIVPFLKRMDAEYEPHDKFYESDISPRGSAQYTQHLRKRNGQWELDMTVNFVHIKVPIQEHQAQAILNGDYKMYLECNVINQHIMSLSESLTDES